MQLVGFEASPATEPLYTTNPFAEEGLAALFVTHPPRRRAGAPPARARPGLAREAPCRLSLDLQALPRRSSSRQARRPISSPIPPAPRPKPTRRSAFARRAATSGSALASPRRSRPPSTPSRSSSGRRPMRGASSRSSYSPQREVTIVSVVTRGVSDDANSFAVPGAPRLAARRAQRGDDRLPRLGRRALVVADPPLHLPRRRRGLRRLPRPVADRRRPPRLLRRARVDGRRARRAARRELERRTGPLRGPRQ